MLPEFLHWPFFEDRHKALAEQVDAWAAKHCAKVDHSDVDTACLRLVAEMGKAGLLKNAVVAPYGGAAETLDVRSLCIIREICARYDGLADFGFAMQGLGSGPIVLFGTDQQKQRFLPPVAEGTSLGAFALTEPQAGSDAAALTTSAERDGDDYVLNGEKTWISNGGIAGQYVVFARTGAMEDGARGLSAFIVPADTPGLEIAERLEIIAPHPLATLKFSDCRIPADFALGPEGAGFKIAMATLDVFRSTVGAAALGFAKRAYLETVGHIKQREISGRPLADYQMTQGKVADMAVAIDAAGLLVYRAAWTKDQGAERVTREAAMAKLFATEQAQLVIDQAVQLHGALGVKTGSKVEELYREIRALRIYEGASEVQKLVIARQSMG
jgi:acyl-CoA dehydrogenase